MISDAIESRLNAVPHQNFESIDIESIRATEDGTIQVQVVVLDPPSSTTSCELTNSSCAST